MYRFVFFLALSVALLLVRPLKAQIFTHPGIPFTTSDLNQLKKNINQQPWKSAYESLAADKHSSLDYQMQGPFAMVSRAPHINRNQWLSDMQAIHNLTFIWVFTGKTAYAQKATDLLNAWAITNKEWKGDEAILDLGDVGQYYATAADILRSTFNGWTKENTANVGYYFANVLWPALDIPNPVRGANQGSDAIKAAIGIAVFLNDREKFKQAIDSYRSDPAGGLPNSLPNGQLGDYGRDGGHSYGQLWNLSWVAEVAWKQGIDLYTDLDNRLLKAGELYASHLSPSASSAFIPFGNPYGYYTQWGLSGWQSREPRALNILLGAYVIRKGLEAPFLSSLRDAALETKESFLYRKTEDTSTAKVRSAILHPLKPTVVKLLNKDIGNVSAPGFTTKRQNELTIGGAGHIAIPSGSDADAFQFAYQAVNGDAIILARIDQMADNTTESWAGLMIRGSLQPNAKFAGVFLQPAVGIKTTWRGAKSFCKTDVSWAIQTQTPRNYEIHELVKGPYWLKIERLGNRVSVYHSPDAQNWTCLENIEISLGKKAYVGLCVAASDTTPANTVVFSNISIYK